MNAARHWDDIVVGAGSSGAVIAARLSEEPNRRVLLLEAGTDFPQASQLPAALLDANMAVLDGHNWHIQALVRNDATLETLRTTGSTFLHAAGGDRIRMARTALQGGAVTTFDYCVGRVVGGSSAINGALALRGVPEDYDEWRPMTSGQWDWQQVLPFFRAIEHDADFDGPHHGRDGPIPVRRERREELVGVQAAFLQACEARAYPVTADHNDPGSTGVGIVPKNVRDQRRVSAALAYLEPARHRLNLSVVGHAHVHRLNWKAPGVCAGVTVDIGGVLHQFESDRVVLCGGTLNTPTLLMRSGIGDADHLRSHGIETRLALAGVGRNLIDHPVVGLWAVPKPEASVLHEPTHQVLLRYTAEASRARNDMQIHMSGGIDTAVIPSLKTALGAPVGMAVTACLMKPVSRGTVRLANPDPHCSPQVVVNCLGHPDDVTRLKEGVRRAWDLIQHASIARHVARIFAWNRGVIDAQAALERAIFTFVRPGWHPVGTVRMGNVGDPEAVVDAFGKVHGAANVWVADASIMPTIPSAPTNLTCIMIGERIAAGLRRLR